jgi:hypothetical protein
VHRVTAERDGSGFLANSGASPKQCQPMNTPAANPSQETVVWSGPPSQKSNVGLYSFCALIALVLVVCAVRLHNAEGDGYVWAALLLPIGIVSWRWSVSV